jgi:hypothetical protein
MLETVSTNAGNFDGDRLGTNLFVSAFLLVCLCDVLRYDINNLSPRNKQTFATTQIHPSYCERCLDRDA